MRRRTNLTACGPRGSGDRRGHAGFRVTEIAVSLGGSASIVVRRSARSHQVDVDVLGRTALD